MIRFISISCVAILVLVSVVRASNAQEMGATLVAPENQQLNAVATEGIVDPAEREMRNRLQPILKKELSFAARVCSLDKAQRNALAEAGQEAVKKTAHEYTQAQRNAAQPGVVVFQNRVQNGVLSPSNPVKMLQSALQDVIKEKLPADKSLLLNAEYAKRADFRKQAMIENIVVMLDKKLALTPEQRADITKSLAADWDDSWVPQMQIFMFDQDVLPRFPDKCVTPHLQPAQLIVWGNLPNKNVQFAVDAFEVDPITGPAANDANSDDDP